MIYQIIAASSDLGGRGLTSWHFSVEDISLALFGALVVLMADLLLMLALVVMLIAGFLFYQFTRTVGTALVQCAQHQRHWFELSKFPWWINQGSPPTPKIT